MDYTLTDNNGTVLDTSDGNDPFAYIHGTGSIIPGLEEALEGKKEGDTLKVVIPPEKAYGERNDEMIINIPKERFQNPEELQPGMEFQIPMHGGVQVMRILKIEDDQIVADGNHPLAGETLNFDVTVRGVREASAEELEAMNDHGCGCGCGDEESCDCEDEACGEGSCGCGK